MVKDDFYRVGIIGCGRIAGGIEFEKDNRRKRPCTHAAAYKKNLETKVLAAADPNPSNLKIFSKMWNVRRTYSDFKEMLNNESLDIVSICTPAKMHLEVAKYAAKSGVKTIFCEKPIAPNLKEVKEMLECLGGTRLIINHNRRWDSYFNFSKDLVDKGKIGKIVSITGRYTSGLRVMGTHMVDILRYFCGDADWVFGNKEKTNVKRLPYSENYKKTDQSYSGLIKFKNGILGFLEGSCKKNYFIFEVDIQGVHGRILLQDNLPVKDKKITFWKKGDYNNFYGLTKENLSCTKYNSPILIAVEEVVNCTKTGKQSISSGYEAYKSMQIIDALSKSAELEKKIYL